MRDGTNDYRLFEEMRLHPWKPDNKLKIDAHIAMLSVTEPKLAQEYREKYDMKMAEWQSKQPVLQIAKNEEVPAEIVEVPKEVYKPKRKKKSSPTL